MAGGSRGGQRGGGVVVIAAAAADRAHGGIGAVGGDGIAVGGKGGRVGGVAGYGNCTRVLRVAVLPLHEVVAGGSRGGQGGGGAVVIAAAAADAAHGGIGAAGSDGVAVGREGGRVGGVARYGDSARIIGVAVLPLHEMVPSVGCGGQGGGGIVVVASAAAHCTHAVVVGVGSDGVAVGGEGGRVGGVADYGNRARVVGVAVVPLHKVVTRGGRGGQRGGGIVVVASSAAHRTHTAVVGVGGNVVAVDGEVGGEADVTGNVESVGVEGGDLGIAFLPRGEVVARGGRGGNGNRGVFLHAAAAGTADRALRGIGRGDRDVVVGDNWRVDFEGGRIGGVVGYGNGARVVGVAVLPLEEVVATVSRGRQRGGGVVVVAAAAGNRTHGSIGTVGSDGVAVGREGGRVGGVARYRDGARVLRVAVLPLHKVVARSGRGRQRGGGVVVVAAAASNGTHGCIGAVGGYGVAVGHEMGGEADVTGNVEGVGVEGGHLCVAFLPCGEVVARGGRGSQVGQVAVSIPAAAADTAHGAVV